MAGRRFDVADVVEVLRLWDSGRTDREIARSTGMGRYRVAKITKAAASAGLTRGAVLTTDGEWATQARLMFASRVGGRIGDQERRIEQFHDEIEKRVQHSTVTTAWQRAAR